MTTFYLVRHGAHVLDGERIAGRTPGVHLSPLGHRQAARAAKVLSQRPICAVYSSPLDRTLETARPLAERLGLPVQVNEALLELDFGDWTGKPLDELRQLETFRQWNTHRSGTRIPNGEMMLETQARVVREIHRLREVHPDGHVALFSHGDVIKSAVAHFLGVPLDLMLRIEISLGSVSVVQVGDYGPSVLCVNSLGALPPDV